MYHIIEHWNDKLRFLTYQIDTFWQIFCHLPLTHWYNLKWKVLKLKDRLEHKTKPRCLIKPFLLLWLVATALLPPPLSPLPLFSRPNERRSEARGLYTRKWKGFRMWPCLALGVGDRDMARGASFQDKLARGAAFDKNIQRLFRDQRLTRHFVLIYPFRRKY